MGSNIAKEQVYNTHDSVKNSSCNHNDNNNSMNKNNNKNSSNNKQFKRKGIFVASSP